MSEYVVQIDWAFSGKDFRKGQYSREHTWTFDGGVMVPASSSPGVVPAPYSNAAHVDPEEAFVAAIASCHMLSFLYVAAQEGCEVTHYADRAIGRMTKNVDGVLWVSSVMLYPRITYGASAPNAQQEEHLHERAHHECFIANSVKTEITVTKSFYSGALQ